ncbi:MAG: hypothetical protein HN731_17190 [Rhodospirillaceae bacterium]|jgi:hypothetical protein|nr:hypothetical protein [Rhodospirillaceae bacterium]MBT5942004.1 hypothetical protein [Rhodospirillaceae bacterium]MBT7956935.1 hypothetical protein [Rhodospirillaceae bacterium]
MPILFTDHHLTDFGEWIQIFKSNPPPTVGNWHINRGVDDPNRVQLVAELDAVDVPEVEAFLNSDKMKTIFEQVNKISTQPIEFVWLENVNEACEFN